MSPTEAIRRDHEYPLAGQGHSFVVTQAEVQGDLERWWKELLNLDHVDLDDDFFDLGGNSIVGLQLFSAIKPKYGLRLALSLLFEARTIRQLAEHIQSASQGDQHELKPTSVLVPLQPKGVRPPVFWIPGGFGATVSVFKDVSLLLGTTDRPAYGFEVQMPEQDQEMESIEDRAKFFINEMRALQPQGPYHLIGFCGGGYIAYEMAQRLSAEGHQIGFLGIVDCADPHYPHNWEQKLRFNAERAVWRVRRFLERGPMGIARWFIDRSKSVGREFGSGSLRFRDRILGRTRSLALSAPEDLMAKAWRNAKRYYPTTYGGGCTVFIGKDSYEYAGLSPSTDPRLVWCRLSTGVSEVRVIPGDHLKMLEAPNMYIFAEHLKSFLA